MDDNEGFFLQERDLATNRWNCSAASLDFKLIFMYAM